MSGERGRPGVLAWFAGHRVAANLLMLFVVVSGLLALGTTTVEVFPEFSIDTITVRVPYRGATPAETEEGVCLRVEEAVASIQGIDRIRSTAAEGFGLVSIEIEDGADNRRVLDDVKSAVDRIDTFPVETEQPIVSEVLTRRQVVSVVLYGDADPRTLSALAERVRDDLTGLPEISQAEVKGVPPHEISIEVSETALRRWGLTFAEVAEAVRRASLDLPGGSVKTAGGEILLRTVGQRYLGPEFEEVVIRTRPDGTQLRVADVATVIDGFEDTDVSSRFDGHPAALVQVYRTGDEGAIEIAEAVKRHLDESRARLPEGISAATWNDASVVLRQRMGLLLKNARLGLVLVFVSLALFLDLRLAFWTTAGIPISFLGGLWLIPSFDVTINMISLFAFIVVLGIVVDDAIVVGENVFAKREQGLPPLRAAIEGVREMAGPVTFAILTSVAAFLPLVFVEGTFGKVMRNIPVVVISVLVISWVESLLILPAHLSHERTPRLIGPLLRVGRGALAAVERLQKRLAALLQRIVSGPYRRSLEWALDWRHLTMAIATAGLFVTFGLVGGGLVRFSFMPKVDADNVVAYLQMPQGTPEELTAEVATRIEAAALELGRELDAERPGEAPLIRHVNTSVGVQPTAGGGGPTAVGASTATASHLAEVNVELLGGDQREVGSEEVMRRLRDKVGEVPGASALSYKSVLFSAGDSVGIQLAHRDFAALLTAVERLKAELSGYPGVRDIADSFEPGKRELELGLTDEGRTLGLTLSDLARQVRAGFYGEEVQRIQRGRNDIRVMVRYPRAERASRGDLESMRIRLPDGTEAPFARVATVAEGRGYASIERVDRRRVVTVTADVDESVANANEINAALSADVLSRLTVDFPGLAWSFEGAQRQQAESLGSLGRNFVVALFAIFALLAIPFRSYSQPLIVMTAIPFGFVGAIWGHVLMGIDLSLLSLFGMVALAGVVVNDSLIMIDQINRERAAGASVDTAIRASGTKRFRPILLTTLTTFLGLSPMILETSLQARFLIPMAVSLAFGVVFATSVTLIFVPTLYRILDDFHVSLGPEGEGDVEEETAVPAPEPI